MDVAGCHIVNSLNYDSPDGFSSIVSRYVGCRRIPEEITPDLVKVSKGPFYRLREAVKYALSWKDASNPPQMVPHDVLDVNGCRIVTEASNSAPDGVLSTVTREITVPGVLPPDAKPDDVAQPTIEAISRGPFATLKEAVDFAKLWVDPANPPMLPTSEPQPIVEPGIETPTELNPPSTEPQK